MTNEWKEVGTMAEDVWDKEKEIVGVFVERKEDVGPNHSKLYVLDVDGVLTSVWGGTVIDSKFNSIGLGQEVKIIPLGKKKGKNGKEYSDYQFFSRVAPFKEVEPEVNMEEVNKLFGSK